jgi:hypothetical protein
MNNTTSRPPCDSLWTDENDDDHHHQRPKLGIPFTYFRTIKIPTTGSTDTDTITFIIIIIIRNSISVVIVVMTILMRILIGMPPPTPSSSQQQQQLPRRLYLLFIILSICLSSLMSTSTSISFALSAAAADDMMAISHPQHQNAPVYIMLQTFCHRSSNSYDSSNGSTGSTSADMVSSPLDTTGTRGEEMVTTMEVTVMCHPSMNINWTLDTTGNNDDTTSTQSHMLRTLVAHTASIPAYQTILRISKSWTIWDIDAIQDPWILQHIILPQQQQQLKQLQQQPPPLSAAAYLSIYIGRSMFHHDPRAVQDRNHSNSIPWNVYLATLPRHIEEFNGHPIFWSQDELQRNLGTYTVTYHTVRHLQQMIQYEYDVILSLMASQPLEISTVSLQNTDIPPLSLEQYRIARVNVLSRSFGTGPIPLSSDVELDERLSYIYSHLPHLNFTNGHHVMVPILDQWNHHGQEYNVDFAYNIKHQSFMVHSNQMIPMGHEIIDHYGKHTSSHLFAKYGFINYDSSDYSEATIALWHNLHFPYDHGDNVSDVIYRRRIIQDERKYRMQLLRYLQYDDGYETCIGDPQIISTNSNINYDSQNQQQQHHQQQQFMTAAWNMKQLKYQILLSIVGPQSSRWIIQMSPELRSRSNHAQQSPSRHQQQQQQKPPGQIKADHIQTLLSTCRLLVVRHDDYNGTAMNMLQNAIHDNDQNFILPSPFYGTRPSSSNRDAIIDHHNHAFEFRTYMCLARMIQTAMSRFPRSTVSKQWEYIEHLKTFLSSKHDPNHEAELRRNWTIAHIQYSEIQVLETLKQIVFSHLRQHYSDWMNHQRHGNSISNNDTTILYAIRDQPCTFQQYLQPLLSMNYRL